MNITVGYTSHKNAIKSQFSMTTDTEAQSMHTCILLLDCSWLQQDITFSV